MNKEKLHTADYMKALQIVHLGLMAGVAVFGLLSFVLVYSGTLVPENQEVDVVLRYVVPVFAIGGMLASNLIFKQRLKECIHQGALKNKLDYYRGALIVKYAMIEGPAFFALVAFTLTGKLFYMGLAGILLIVLLVNRPTREKAIADLELGYEEREGL